jgi:hypothetical protein
MVVTNEARAPIDEASPCVLFFSNLSSAPARHIIARRVAVAGSFLHYIPAWYWREYILRYTFPSSSSARFLGCLPSRRFPPRWESVLSGRIRQHKAAKCNSYNAVQRRNAAYAK